MGAFSWTKGKNFYHVTWTWVDATDFATIETALIKPTEVRLLGSLDGNSTAMELVSSGNSGLDKTAVSTLQPGVTTLVLDKSDLSGTTAAFYDHYVFVASVATAALVVIPIEGKIAESEFSNFLSNFSDIISDLTSQTSDIESQLATIPSILSATDALQSTFIIQRNSTASQVTSPSDIEIGGAIDHHSQFNGYYVRILGGSQIDELRLITNTNSTTSQLTVTPAFNSRLASAIDYVILPGNPFQSAAHSQTAAAAGGATASQVWGFGYSDLTVTSSIGSLLDARLSTISGIRSATVSNVQRVSQIRSDVSDILSATNRLQSTVIVQRNSTASQVADASVMEIGGAIDHHSQFNGYFVRILGGSQIDELRLITDTNSTTSQLTVQPAFNSRLASAIDYVILPGAPMMPTLNSDMISQLSTINAQNVTENALLTTTRSEISDTLSKMGAPSHITSLVWDALTANYSDAGSFGSHMENIDSRLTAMGGPEHIASLVWDADKGSYTGASSMGSVLQAVGTAAIDASDISDIASAVWGQLTAAHSNAGSFGSHMELIESRTLRIQSDTSDLVSRITGPVATASDVASKVWAEKFTAASNTKASTFGSAMEKAISGISDLDSVFVVQRNSTASQVTSPSEIEIGGAIDHNSQFNGYYVRILGGSQLDELRLITDTNATTSKLTVTPAFNSRLLSAIDYVIFPGNPFQSAAHSQTAAAAGGATASQVWGFGYSDLTVASSIGSALNVRLSTISGLSDTLSKMGGPEHIASLVWDADKGSYVDASSMGSVLQAGTATPSAVAAKVWSDYQSKVGASVSNVVSFLSTVVSDAHSAAVLNSVTLDQINSRVSMTRSDVSDILSTTNKLESAFIVQRNSTASQVVDASVMEIGGAIDHHSQFNGYYVRILGGSQIDELRLIVNTNSTTSQLTVKPAFNSRLLSAIDYVIIPGNPYQSGIHSDVLSAITSAASDVKSAVSNVESALNSQFLIYQSDISNLSDVLSNTHSKLSDMGGPEHIASLVWDADKGSYVDASSMGSVLQAITASIDASDISDIASAVWAEKHRVHSLASSFGSAFSTLWTRADEASSRISGVSDTLSKMGGPEHIASLVWDADKGSYVGASSMGSVLQAGTATPSAVADKVWSDFQSKVGASVSNVVSFLSTVVSDAHSAAAGVSDMLSKMGGPEHIASLVWDADKGSYVGASSMGSVLQAGAVNASAVADKVWSDYESKVGASPSQVFSNLSNAASRLDDAIIAQRGSTASQVASASDIEIDGIDHNSQFNGQFIRILSGSQIQELRLITNTTLASSQLTVTPAFNSRLASGVDYVITDGNPYQSQAVSDLQSNLSDIISKLSDLEIAVSDIESQIDAGVPVSTVQAGAITSASYAAGAIDATALNANAAQEIADEVLNRDIAGGGSGNTRNVRNALRTLRNKVNIAASVIKVHEENDTTVAWSGTISTAAGNPLVDVDPT